MRLIVPQGAGGSTDIISRITAQRMSGDLNQQTVIDNRTGAGGTIGMEIAASAAPDGCTLAHLKAGRIRALGVTSAQRTVALPDLATIAEQAIPGYEAVPWIGLVAPAKTPRDIITRLNQALTRAQADTHLRDQMLQQGAEPGGGTPQAHAAYIAAEHAKWGKVIAQLGVKAD